MTRPVPDSAGGQPPQPPAVQDGGKVERPGALPAAPAPDGIVTPWSRPGHLSPRMARGEAAAPFPLPPVGDGAAQSSGTHHPRPGSVPDPSYPQAGTPRLASGAREGGPGADVRESRSGTAPAQDPPRAVPDETVPSGPAARGGSTGQDARAAWKAAQSALNAGKRRRRGRYRPKGAAPGYGPGMGRRMPPPEGGAA